MGKGSNGACEGGKETLGCGRIQVGNVMNMLARRTRITRREARLALRFCVSVCLVFYIVYTPIHLYLEPHSEEATISSTAAFGFGDRLSGGFR